MNFILIESVAISIGRCTSGGNSKEAEETHRHSVKFELTKGCVSSQKDKGVDE